MAGRSTFLHVLLRCLFVFVVFFVCIPHSSDGSAELEDTLRCALLGIYSKKCQIRDGPPLGPHLFKLLQQSPNSFRNGVLRGRFDDLRTKLAWQVPAALVYLVPTDIWSRVPPGVAAELIKTHKTNEGIAKAVMHGCTNASRENKEVFLRSVDFNTFDYPLNSIMASHISSKWAIDEDTLVKLITYPSFFVALPEAYVLGMDKKYQIAMLDEIVRWDKNGLNEEKWFKLPATTKRVWALMSKNYSYVGQDIRLSTPLLAGASPSELSEEGKLFSEYELIKLPLKNRLQIRALFPIARPEDSLGRLDLSLLKDWFLFLSPDQINRFRDDLDFMLLVKDKQHEYWSYPSHEKPFTAPSVPTLRQILEITTMVNNEWGTLPLDPAAWGDEIALFGPLTFMIGSRRLRQLTRDHKALDLFTLRSIDSYLFSKRMARHLMFNSPHILKVRGLLRGVLTGNLVSSGESGTDGMDQLREIVQNIPADVPARSALVFRRMRENLGVVNNLEAILRNPYPEQFVSLLTLKESGTFYKAISLHWTTIHSENLADKLYLLPDSVLSNLLSAPKILGRESNLTSHLESKCLGGLTCDRLLSLETSSFPQVIAAVRYARKRAGKTEMSKKLQRCARIAMERFLVERGSANYASKKAVLAQITAAINPVDIVNFGGFVMATLTPAEIQGNPHAKEIIKKIGSLSVYELVSAIPCYKCLRKMAETAVEINDGERNLTLSHLVDLGSLVGFLPTRLINAVHPAHWRIITEASSLDGSSQPLCFDQESRNAWEKIIRSAFGPPGHWTGDTLASLGGYMPALREDTLQAVSLEERASSGDTIGITSGSPYLQGVDIVGYDHPRAFWKVCRDLLDQEDRKSYEVALWTAARFQLYSAQLFANKVKNADTLKELKSKKHRATFKSTATETEPPPYVNKQVVNIPPSTMAPTWTDPFWSSATVKKAENQETTTQKPSEDKKSVEVDVLPSTIIPPEKWPWFNPTYLKKDENLEPKTPNPYEGTKLTASEDLDNFISESFDKPRATATSPASTLVSSKVTEAVTQEPTSFSNLEVTDASIAFLKEQIESLSNSSQSTGNSQVYVDPENRAGDEADGFENPSAGLNMTMNEVHKHFAAPSTPEPAKKTNGTVYEFPHLSVTSERPRSKSTLVVTSIESDSSIVVTPAKNVAGISNRTTSNIAGTERPDVSPLTTTHVPSLNLPNAPPNLNGGSTRKRRDVSIQAFEVPLTCDGLLTMGPAAALALSLSDVDMPYEELEDCVEFIGNLELPKEVAKAFWGKLRMATHWDAVGDVGCLLAGMSKEEASNLELGTNGEHFLDTISAVSSYADKEVIRLVISKVKIELDKEIARDGTVALAEEIVLALGPHVCLLPDDTRSFLVNTPNVLVRALAGINRAELFEQPACNPECFRALRTALVHQNKGQPWLAEDLRNAGTLVAGFSEEDLKKMSSVETSQMFAEITAGAVRCLSETQLKALKGESFVWWSPVAAGALSEEHLKAVSAETREIIESAMLGRPGFNSTQQDSDDSTSGATDFTSNLALIVILAAMFVKCYLL